MAQSDVYDDAKELAGDLAIPAEAAVRLRFAGDREGPVSYGGRDGRAYRGSAAPLHRVILVHPDDVDLLLRSGDWLVSAPKPARGRGR